MAEQDFQPFAAAVGANVLTQAEYLALAALGPGFSSGILPSNNLNKVLRQSSIMAAVLGDLIEGVSGQNVLDDGTTTTILSNLASSIMRGGGIGIDSGAANAYIVALPIAPIAYETGMIVRFVPLNANTGASTINVNGLGVVDVIGQAGDVLQGAEIGVAPTAVIFNGTEFELLYSMGGKFQVPPATASNQAVNLGQSVAGGTLLDLTASRSLGTTYTNSTARPKIVMISVI
ncbi:MAG: hypothetical protein B7X10_00800 [Burkholderiales bacterium 21-58-4]|nr:MAG: hypothetical protein B7X10_00800 [Burkholderiales bacterium 21-58-4]